MSARRPPPPDVDRIPADAMRPGREPVCIRCGQLVEPRKAAFSATEDARFCFWCGYVESQG